MVKTYSNVLTHEERTAYEVLELFLQLYAKINIFYEEDSVMSEFILNSIYDPKFGLGVRSRHALKELISAIIKDEGHKG